MSNLPPLPLPPKGKNLFLYFENKLLANTSVIRLLEDFSYGHEDDCVMDARPLVRGAYKMHACASVVRPLETLNGDFRCFTYLSQLDTAVDGDKKNLFRTSLFERATNFEKRTNKVMYVSHALNESAQWHPFERQFRARAMVHSPRELPVPEFYPSIPMYEWSKFFSVQFWTQVSHLLEPPYETNCQHYKTGECRHVLVTC